MSVGVVVVANDVDWPADVDGTRLATKGVDPPDDVEIVVVVAATSADGVVAVVVGGVVVVAAAAAVVVVVAAAVVAVVVGIEFVAGEGEEPDEVGPVERNQELDVTEWPVPVESPCSLQRQTNDEYHRRDRDRTPRQRLISKQLPLRRLEVDEQRPLLRPSMPHWKNRLVPYRRVRCYHWLLVVVVVVAWRH